MILRSKSKERKIFLFIRKINLFRRNLGEKMFVTNGKLVCRFGVFRVEKLSENSVGYVLIDAFVRNDAIGSV